MGANIGMFTIHAVKQFMREEQQTKGHLTVFAFEPIPPVARVLRSNVRAWRSSNVTLHSHDHQEARPAQAEDQACAPSSGLSPTAADGASTVAASGCASVHVLPVGLSSEVQSDVTFLYHPHMTLWQVPSSSLPRLRFAGEVASMPRGCGRDMVSGECVGSCGIVWLGIGPRLRLGLA